MPEGHANTAQSVSRCGLQLAVCGARGRLLTWRVGVTQGELSLVPLRCVFVLTVHLEHLQWTVSAVTYVTSAWGSTYYSNPHVRE